MHVVVVGAGIVGLLAALELVERGHVVEVVSAEPPERTTSATAGASFKPRAVAPGHLTDDLLRRSRLRLQDWDRSGRSAAFGIVRHRHRLATDESALGFPSLDQMDDVVHHRPPDTVAGRRTEVSFETWFFDVPRVLPAIVEHLAGDHHVETTIQRLDDLDDVAAHGQVVVNATGVGARRLVGDDRVEPIAGQGVTVGFEEVPDWSVSADGFYAYPREGGLFLGGTADRGRWSRQPDPVVTRALVTGNARVFPGLADLDDAAATAVVGLRPYRRGGIRIAPDRRVASVPVVHAYGHGGSGWTLAPGTAVAVADLVEDLDRHG